MTRHVTSAGYAIIVFTIAVSAFAVLSASAATPAEARLLTAPMPHLSYGAASAKIKVHLARLQGYFEGEPSNAIRLQQLKGNVQKCVADNERSGHPSHPPTEWPDYLISIREDIYYASNRSIRYSRGVSYLMNPGDCSLIEGATSTARLLSSKGVCIIDLDKKTATGACDAGLHDAAPTTIARADFGANNAALRRLANGPRTAAMEAAIQKSRASNNTSTGKKKIIAGVECDIWNQTAMGSGATICLASGGSFTPARTAGNTAESGMMLELQSNGVKISAVEAKLDAEVDSHVFEPHLAGGFAITHAKSHQ